MADLTTRLRALAAQGLLTPDLDVPAWLQSPADHLRRVLAELHTTADGPTLDDAEAALTDLEVPGLDARAAARLVARACLHTGGGRVLLDGWPVEHVAPWVRRRADVLLRVHEADSAVQGYSRPVLVALLGTLDPLPDDVADWLWPRALGTASADRSEAQLLLTDHPQRGARSRAALGHRTAGVRAAAAAWLAAAPLPDDAAVVPALEDAVRGEQGDPPLGSLLAALVAHGRPAVDYLDREALDAAAAKAGAKPLPASLSWLVLEALPRVRWADTGAEVAPTTVRSWVQQAVRAKATEPDALLGALLASLDADDRTALAGALLHRWLAAGAPTVSRGILAVVAAGAGEEVVLLAADFVRTRAKQRSSQAQALVALLARVDHPLAMQALVEAADTSAATKVRQSAAEEVAALAVRRGWTVEQVGDRGTPTSGFDATGRLRLDYGDRAFTAVLQPDLKVLVEPDDGGKTRTSLPPARAADDPDRVREAKATLAAAKKSVVATARTQTARLRDAMTRQRTWTAGAWRSDVAGHPVLARIASGLVWSAGGRTFRPLDDGTLTDADDEPVELGPDDVVSLTHTVLLDAATADAWRAHLADYEVPVPFAQLAEALPPVDPESTGLTEAVGTRTTASALHRTAERAGFERIVDGGYVAAYTRPLPDGLGATFEVRGDAWIGEWSAEVELGPLLITDAVGPVRLDRLPPVLLAELRHDLLAMRG